MNQSTRRCFLSTGTAIAVAACTCRPSWRAMATEWIDDASHGPFVCRADFPLDPYISLFDELASLQRELIRTLAIQPAQEPIEIYMFHDRPTYEAYLRQLYPSVPYRRALFVKSGNVGRVFAYRDNALPVDLRHECTHALLHASQPMVPLWLDEGLAEYFEIPEQQRAFDHPHLKAVRWNMRLGMIPSLRSLEAKSGILEMGGMEYRFSWAWVHFMLHGPAIAHQELVHFLADVRHGKPPGLLSLRLALAVTDVEVRFVQHFKYWKHA